MLIRIVWNEDVDENGMQWRCQWIWYEMKILMNMAWNEDANEYGMQWRC